MKKINEIKTFIKFVLVLFAVGCTQEAELPRPETPLAPFTVKEARMWFEANLEPVLKARTQSITKSGEAGMPSLIPFFDWSKAITGFNKDWSVVELPWEYKNGKVVFSIDGAGSNEPDFAADSLQLVRLVMAKNLNTNDVYAFQMVVLPDPQYLEQGDNLPENQYLQMQSDFWGLVLFYDVFGEFVVGYTYEQGRIINKLTTYATPEKGSEEVIRPKSGSGSWIFIEACTWERHFSGDWSSGNINRECRTYVFWVSHANGMAGGGGGGFTGDPIQPIGWDPGGGGGIPTAPPQMMPRASNPCEKVQFLGNSDLFRSKMAKLVGYTGKNFEAGYLLRNNHNGTFSYEYMRGPDGTFEIGIDCCPQRQILGLIHSHPVGGLPIFTVYDIGAIYQAYRLGCIENLQNLPIGVVTPQGAYMLVISNVQKFLAFGSMFLRNDDIIALFTQGVLDDKLSQFRNPEKAFLRFLGAHDAGLMLFRGSHTDFGQWEALRLNFLGNPVVNPNPC